MQRALLCALLFFVLCSPAWCQFAISPYLQVDQAKNSLLLRWAVPSGNNAAFTVEVQRNGQWEKLTGTSSSDIRIGGSPALKLYSQLLPAETNSLDIHYRVMTGDKAVFSADAHPAKSANQSFKLLVLGDCGQGSPEQKKVAACMFSEAPDLVAIAGDIVYPNGRLSEYLTKFFPVYNADKASPKSGAPLLRSVPFIACPGNHDTCREGPLDGSDLSACPDGLAYYYLWRQPLNGPDLPSGMGPHLQGSDQAKEEFLSQCKDAFPRMGNFSLNYGCAHILCLDANDYIDWSNQQLQDWVDADLQAAADMPWKIVMFHQASFSSDKHHFEDQQMRVLAPIFEKRGVAVVFAGHTHTYQRSIPLKFAPSSPAHRTPEGFVYGKFSLDKKFADDGSNAANGIVYVVSGAGGAPLSVDPDAKNTDAWQPFTRVYRNDVFCFSECEISPASLVFKQVADNGRVIDAFQLNHANR